MGSSDSVAYNIAHHIRSLNQRGQVTRGGLARLQEGREVRTLAQLGDAQAQRAEPDVEAAVA